MLLSDSTYLSERFFFFVKLTDVYQRKKADLSTSVISIQSRNIIDISARQTKNCLQNEDSSLRIKR